MSSILVYESYPNKAVRNFYMLKTTVVVYRDTMF
jgi:hypothetical protein